MNTTGRHTPSSAATRITRSARPPRDTAASAPEATPSTSHSTAAPIAMETVTGSRSAISDSTESCSRQE